MLHYSIHELGPEKPWVTFVHGAGGSSSIWFRQVREFSKHFNVLLIDLRGHGQSKGGAFEKLRKYTFSTISDEVMEVLDHLGIAKSHFVGISLGTIIIREIAERFPKRVSSMIQGGAVMELDLRARVLMRFGDKIKNVIPFIWLYRFFAFIIMPKKSHRESRHLFIREAKKVYDKEFKRWFSLVADIKPLLKLFRMRESGIPTLYIMGSEDHMFLPSINKLVENHKLSTLFIIDDCGHVVNVEQPEIFNRTAIDFLQA